MIPAFTLQEEEILCKVTGAGGREAQGTGIRPSCFKLGWEAPFSVFLRLFKKSIVEQ